MRGVDKVDSFNANMSKVGLGGTDSSPMWVRNRFGLINSFSETPDHDEHHENQLPKQGKGRDSPIEDLSVRALRSRPTGQHFPTVSNRVVRPTG